jgi:hypothetical protein
VAMIAQLAPASRLVSYVRKRGAVERPLGELGVGEKGHGCAGPGVERETMVAQTLIRGWLYQRS